MKNLFLYYLVFINIIGFLSMYLDKIKAKKHQWRTKESTLILIGALGGSIGSILGMYIFRHKTKHLKFTLGIPFIILIQLSIIIYYYKFV
ncbi:DUF1294 domain-containing protein [Clostridium hydrogeniformans]|uniref:DUF1294 domain-containing protein n=1 Tax=Clostridium hydrogeniformans TaxID=349933 RepID=UPI00048985BD|nr:DUF1294 domain-containing protein [Clostridium hydrogeniformans]